MIISSSECSCGFVEVKEIVTVELLLGGHDKNPEYAKELTDEIKTNLKNLAIKVNSLLQQLGVTSANINSGWRPAAHNKKIGGAANSLHVKGKAVDLSDPTGTIKKLCENNQKELKSRDVAMEHANYTIGWCHLQDGLPKSGNVIFIPYAGPPKKSN